ncbi:hypothetical protein D046_4635, partial [Vibrio parahaemolyticus V-223/04]
MLENKMSSKRLIQDETPAKGV